LSLAVFDLAGWVLIRNHLWSLRAGQEVASSAFGLTREWPQPAHSCNLKRNFPFHWLFLDLLLSRSDLKGKEFKEGTIERKKSLGALKF
jgi:hypothetical protein